MALVQRFCKNHPDRPAIGVCVVTKHPICAECSTRQDGVNYSKEGLEILRRRRERESRGDGSSSATAWGLAILTLIVCLPLLFAAFYLLGITLINIWQMEFV
jgi:hypothetical protein